MKDKEPATGQNQDPVIQYTADETQSTPPPDVYKRQGNTLSDYSKEEQKRHFSISTSVIPIEWEGYKINIIDTPGYFDFVGEVEEAVSAAGAAIIVVNGKSGIEVGTQKAWELCEKYKLPRFIYVSNMDVDNASFRQVVEDMTKLYGKKMAPFHLPIRENEKFVGYINVITESGNRWEGKEVVPCEVPDYSQANLQICRDTLMEAVAEKMCIRDSYGCFADVVLDTCGGAFGLLVCGCVEKIVRRRKQKRKDKEKEITL